MHIGESESVSVDMKIIELKIKDYDIFGDQVIGSSLLCTFSKGLQTSFKSNNTHSSADHVVIVRKNIYHHYKVDTVRKH